MENKLSLLMEELRLRKYSPRTIKAYYFHVKKSLKYQSTRLYLLHLEERGQSAESINVALSALKFYYRNILRSKEKLHIKTAKRAKKLPYVLSRMEIKQILEGCTNLKHRLLLALAYGSGLRVSEVVSLKICDVHLDENLLHIKKAKGNKDRLTILAESLKTELEFLMQGRSKYSFIFESQRGGKLTTRTAQKIFKQGLERANIQKEASFHSLRHSFATHLLENGTDIRYVQELLGHNNIRTTERYTQVTKTNLQRIPSPL